jgi:hypothetical protein
MLRRPRASGLIAGLLLLLTAAIADCQLPLASSSDPDDQAGTPRASVVLTVVDENNVPVPGASVTILESGRRPLSLQTDYAGRISWPVHTDAPYQLQVAKPGFYQLVKANTDTHLQSLEVVLTHVQIVRQQVSVVASSPGIDPEQTSNRSVMNTPEIVNVPYQNSRDIRNLLPFIPGIIQDNTGQVHLAGSPTYATLDLLDGFDIRSPVSGALAIRVSADAVRSIVTQTTRYPVEFGKATGGVVAFYTGMGDNKFRFNATDFIPSFHQVNGIRFDKFVPRFTFSGPIVRDRAWFFDGLELEYDNIYIKELPANADTNHLFRGSNLAKAQVNLSPADILSFGLLYNHYHSPYDGISARVPQQSTSTRNTPVWLPYVREQHIFSNGILLDSGFAVSHIRDSRVPHGDAPYELTPETSLGSFFENSVARSLRAEGTATLYLPPRHWAGRHDLKTGIELDHIGFDQQITRAPVNYLREDGTLLRQSVFPPQHSIERNNIETGAYFQDRWRLSALNGLLVEAGLRFDWDQIIRRPLFSPRLAVSYAPLGPETKTKVTGGVGLYYEHTQLEYLTRALDGVRYDTYYATDGTTPIAGPLQSIFVAHHSSLTAMHALNWSLGVEQKLPGQIYASANFIDKSTRDAFVYANHSDPAGLTGTWVLTNNREDNYHSFDIEARRSFANGYTLFAAYTRSYAHTNAAIDYVPTVSLLGPQQSGPLPWDAPNRLISWGWLPFAVPWFKKNWDFVYTVDWRSGFPFTSINANRQVVGAPGSKRFPDFLSLSPGLEWRFHLRGAYFGLRGILENATDRQNPSIVNNVVDSPAYGTFSQPFGRALTARLRLIGSK